MKNLNKEISRMKSLFSDERLYGNLVNEACTEDEAKATLKTMGYISYKESSSTCDVSTIPHLKCVKELLEASGLGSSDIKIFHQESSDSCIIQVKKNLKSFGGSTKIVGDMNLIFWEKGTYGGKNITFAMVIDMTTPFDSGLLTSVGGAKLKQIEQLIYRGYFDADCKNLKFFVVDGKHSDGLNIKKVQINGVATTVQEFINNLKF